MFNPNAFIKNLTQGAQTDAFIALVARVLMAYIFIMAGWGKSQLIMPLWDIWNRWVSPECCYL